MDYVDFGVDIFLKDRRVYYDIERLRSRREASMLRVESRFS